MATEMNKLKELILYVSRKSEFDQHFGATKLNKILFCADFLAYQRYGSPITGTRYQKLPFGPAPRSLVPAIRLLEEEGACVTVERTRATRKQKRLIPTRDADLSPFSAAEIALVDEVIEQLWDHNATAVSEWSHDFIGWKLAEIGEDIPYDTVFVGEPRPLTPEEVEYGQRVAEGGS